MSKGYNECTSEERRRALLDLGKNTYRVGFIDDISTMDIYEALMYSGLVYMCEHCRGLVEKETMVCHFCSRKSFSDKKKEIREVEEIKEEFVDVPNALSRQILETHKSQITKNLTSQYRVDLEDIPPMFIFKKKSRIGLRGNVSIPSFQPRCEKSNWMEYEFSSEEEFYKIVGELKNV